MTGLFSFRRLLRGVPAFRIGAASGVLLFCCVLAGSVLAGPVLAADSPEAAVADIQHALDAGDLPRFERRVDVDALARQGSAIFMDLLRDSGQKDTKALLPVVSFLAAAVNTPEKTAVVQGLLAGETASFIRDGVDSGRFGGKAGAAGGGRGVFAPLFAEVSAGRKELRAVGPARAVAGESRDAVDLPVVVRDAGSGRDYRALLRLERSVGPPALWKVTRIADLPDIAAVLWKEALSSK